MLFLVELDHVKRFRADSYLGAWSLPWRIATTDC